MSKNLGNSGHTGYKMPKVLDIIARDGEVVTLLTCGHEFSFVPFEVQCQTGLYTDVKVHSGACYWELHAENFCGVAVTLLPKAPEPVQQTRTFPTID